MRTLTALSSRPRTRWLLAVAVLAAGTLPLAAWRSAGTEPIPFKEATLIVETNATDGDAGLQIFLDHEPWRSIAVHRPDGSRILEVTTQDVLEDYGLTELFSESSEPPFAEFPLERFKKLFPEGPYLFAGETVDGVAMRSHVTLSHDFPAGPVIRAPADGSTAAGMVVVGWEPVTEPAGIDIVGYEVLVTHEDPLQVFSADLPATATEVTVPPQFLEPGSEYKVEVLAIEAGGNQTLSEITFTAV